MNEHDSEKMSALLQDMGLSRTSGPEGADVVLINTCSIREKAEHKVYSALGKLKSLKRRNPDMVTVVCGCVAQQEKENLLKRVSHLDAVLGTHCIADLPAVIERIRKNKDRVARTVFTSDTKSLHINAPMKGQSPICSYVTIMQGCSNFCSYCVVPFTRGPEQSRATEEILREVNDLVERGVKEITLLGQNVNAYGKDSSNTKTFASLLKELDRVKGLSRIRFTTSHPKDFGEDLISAMAELPSVCEHVHLPLQSGSDSILKAMRRGYDLSEYQEKIRLLRQRIPQVAVTADMIVGFPGETEQDFQTTLAALAEIRFDQIFSFKYSRRPGTAARNLADQVSEEIKSRRLEQVHHVQDRITEEYHKAAEGTLEEILVEGFRPGTGQPFGRTRTNKIVNIEPHSAIGLGDNVKVTIVRGLKHSLYGRKID